MKKVFRFTKGFMKGIKNGFDWYYYILFEQKLPKWLAYSIGIVILPINWFVVLIVLILGKGKEMFQYTIDAMIDVEIARNKEN